MVLRTVIDRVLTDSNKIIQLENPESVDIEFLWIHIFFDPHIQPCCLDLEVSDSMNSAVYVSAALVAFVNSTFYPQSASSLSSGAGRHGLGWPLPIFCLKVWENIGKYLTPAPSFPEPDSPISFGTDRYWLDRIILTNIRIENHVLKTMKQVSLIFCKGGKRRFDQSEIFQTIFRTRTDAAA